MAKYYIRWHANYQMLPTISEERVKLLLSLLEMIKQDMQAGKVKDWGNVPGESGGYFIAEEVNEADFYTNLLRFIPYINFEVKPILTVDQTIESIKKAVATAQAKK